MERREVLTILIGGGSIVGGLVVGVPTVIYAFNAIGSSSEAPRWRDVGLLDDFPISEMSEGIIQHHPDSVTNKALRRGVYVWRGTENELIVFSRSCTDLGCPVTFDQRSHCFLCPCHGGIFSKNGDRMAGPPDRPLYRYTHRVEAGILQVDLSSVPPMV